MTRLAHYISATWPPLILTLIAAVTVWLSPWLWLTVLGIFAVILALLDAKARYREFRTLRGYFLDGNMVHSSHMVRRMRPSFCGRVAAAAAAASVRATFARSTRDFYFDQGYRPWHVFPDNAFTMKSPFLRPSFWARVVGLN